MLASKPVRAMANTVPWQLISMPVFALFDW